MSLKVTTSFFSTLNSSVDTVGCSSSNRSYIVYQKLGRRKQTEEPFGGAI